MKRAVLSLCLAFAAGTASAAPEVHAYLGSGKCRPCHQSEYASWSRTRMAKAYELLKPGTATTAKLRAKLDPAKDYTREAHCLGCHTTGYGKPGGFVDAKSSPDLAGVGCESCHGAGASYAHSMTSRRNGKTEFVSAGLVPEVGKEQCVGCHNSGMGAGTVIGSRHFVKQFVFSATKGVHEQQRRKLNP